MDDFSRELHDIDWYLDRARDVRNLQSDRALGDMMNLSTMGISSWRTRRAWPEDDKMVTLCQLAKVPPEIGLLDLGRWRAKGMASEIWARMLPRMAATLALPALVIFSLAFSPVPAFASEAKTGATVYYGYSRRFRLAVHFLLSRFGSKPFSGMCFC